MLRPKTWIVLLLVCCLAEPVCGAQGPRVAVFPKVSGYNLDKDKVELPAGMTGRVDLLILSFAPEQQKDVNSWMPVAQALQHLNFDFRYYQLPIFGDENFVFRWWDVSSMRSDLTDPASWPWVVPLFVNKQKFLRSLRIPNQKQVVVLLVDRQGQILWRESGPLTEAKRGSVIQAVNQQQGR